MIDICCPTHYLYHQPALPDAAPWCPAPTGPDGILHVGPDNATVGAVREATTAGPGNYMAFVDAVYQCLRQGGPSPVPIADAVAVMRVIDACVASAEQRRVVSMLP
jgi:predicted dehydrogenase